MSHITFNIKSLPQYKVPTKKLPAPLPLDDLFLKNVISCFRKESTFSGDFAFLQAPKLHDSLYESINEIQISRAYSLILSECDAAFDNLIYLLSEMSIEEYFLHPKNSLWGEISRYNDQIIDVVKCVKSNEVLRSRKVEESLARFENKMTFVSNAIDAISAIQMVRQINNLAVRLFNKKFSSEEKDDWEFYSNNHSDLLTEIQLCSLSALPQLIHSALKKSTDDLEILINYFKFFQLMKKIVSKRSFNLLSLKELKSVKGTLSNICYEFESLDRIFEINTFINNMILSNTTVMQELDQPTKMRFWFTTYAGKIKQINAIFIGTTISEGTFKIVYKALFVQFIRKDKVYTSTILPSVYSIIKDSKQIGLIKKTLKILDDILKQIPTEKLDLFVPYPLVTYSKTPEDLELLYPWLHGDCYDAARLEKVPLDIFCSKYDAIRLPHLFQMLIDACDALIEVHKLGFVHLDIKTGNLLVRNKMSWGGALSDWDLADPQGVFDSIKYAYWNSCTEIGVYTFECDGYGIVISLGIMLFGVEFYRFRNKRELILTSEFDTFLNKSLSGHASKYFGKLFDNNPINKERVLSHFKRLKLLDDKEIFDLIHHIQSAEGVDVEPLVKELMMLQHVHGFIRFAIKVDAWILEQIKNDEVFFSKLTERSLTNKEFVDYFVQFRLKIVAKWKFNPFDVSVLYTKISAMHEALSKK